MIADTNVARALSVLRSGPIFKLPSAIKVGPFSFFGFIQDNTLLAADLRLAGSRSDSSLDAIAAGNNPGITLIITALSLRYDETATLAQPSDGFLLQRQVELRQESNGVLRSFNLSQYSCTHQSNPTNGNVAQTVSGSPDRGPRMLSVPLVVDMEHDAVFAVQPRQVVNMAADMPFNLQLYGIAFSNSLRFSPSDCIDDASAVQIGQQGAAMDAVLSPAWNPDAYR